MRRARLAAALGLAVGLVALVVGPTSVAGAATPDQTSGREITRYDVTADVADDGTMRVDIDLDFDFGDDPGHGPYLTLPLRTSYDADRDRVFRYSDITATSPSGAPAQVHREDDGDAMVLRIGDEDVDDVSGVQTYDIGYTVRGFLNPANAQHTGDELYWNVIGAGWEIPLGDLSVHVSGPDGVQGAVCYAGSYGSTTSCTSAAHDASSATFTQDLLGVGDQLSVTVGWPGGTFPQSALLLEDKPDPLGPVRPLSGGGAAALLVVAAGSFLAVRRVRATGRDRAYLGLTPGLRPVGGAEGSAGYRDKRAPVAVQFAPPTDVRPGALGTLVDEKADPVDVTATLVDLAVRGYLRIDEVPRSDPRKKVKDWTLVLLRDDDAGLAPAETTLLHEIFSGSRSVKLSDLRTTFASSMKKVQSRLYDEVTDRGWFRRNPSSVRGSWAAAGIGLVVAAVLLTIFVMASGVTWPGVALVPIGLGLVGVVVLACARFAPARTADGTAVLAQTLGFRQYLATAEAEQLRFEEGEDIFSRYLPYAIVFGLAERWARVFADLAAQGRVVAQPAWYTGYYPNPLWITTFAGSMDRFSSVATESISAPTPGSSGSSAECCCLCCCPRCRPRPTRGGRSPGTPPG
ncbi:DUF2207 domain-containing protein [Cellulomonas sp. HZM]|uniref:DUF2207 domain-containing protein n=1 Tax=Cellulomonas sp. HZM TaxID=1454010 RepID=UPI00068E577D|nr:DUF2207 domain-containing protein [Cellulomonas sp. HZM]